jgi:cytochrome P450
MSTKARLPAGPTGGRLAQTVALHRDPLAFLRSAQERYGDIFTVRLATTGPVVVLAGRDSVAAVAEADPERAHAGAARRGMLPMASPRSTFGGDDAEHAAARRRIAPAFAPEAVEAARPAMTSVVRTHVARWPRARPFRLLPRMRALADELFARFVLGLDDQRGEAMARAMGSLLWTPGNPPVTIPGPQDGLLGRAVDAEYRRRRAPVAALLSREIADRRASGDPGAGALGLVLADEPERPADDIVEELLAVLMAAQEPMAAALTWTTLRIAGDTAARERVLADGPASQAGRGALWEALRLHPSALGVLRELTAPAFGLPAGTTTMVPIPVVQRDARWWGPDADAFRPGRATGTAGQPLLPFGGGTRRCVGQALAWTELDAALPIALAERLRPVGPQPERMVLRATILVPQRGGLVRHQA